MIIDQKRAHERILYESYLLNLSMGPVSTQQELFPQSIDLSGRPGAAFVFVDDLAYPWVVRSAFFGEKYPISVSVNAYALKYQSRTAYSRF